MNLSSYVLYRKENINSKVYKSKAYTYTTVAFPSMLH